MSVGVGVYITTVPDTDPDGGTVVVVATEPEYVSVVVT